MEMVRTPDHMTQCGKLQEFIAKQKIFFVGTATAEGRVNMSPKGMDSLTRPPKSSPNVKLIKTIW